MQVLMIFFIWSLNFLISWANARTVGITWDRSDGWQGFLNWMGALMSASGFTWCFLLPLLGGAYLFQTPPEHGEAALITIQHVESGFSLGYLLIIPGVLFSGLMITADSIMVAYRRRTVGDVGTAAYNTFAQAHNMYNAAEGIPSAWGSASKLFDSKGNNKGNALVLVLVILAVFGGIICTYALVQHYRRQARYAFQAA
jgi:hypothetical protein